MSNEETPIAEENSPIFQLQKLYVKDISFENPNAPQIFVESQNQLNIEFSLALNNQRVDDEHWEVSLKINIVAHDKGCDKNVFEIEVEHAGIFVLRNIPEEHVTVVLAVECPTIIFPYTRQIISQATVDGGFMPFLMEPVNFRAVYEGKLQQEATEAAEANKGMLPKS
ncbi:MAG: protein-export chaperone SecB [Mariprofundaceae bacterium]|nr:protein-export chaperone SecB [Mariprofundaceae bacterium]